MNKLIAVPYVVIRAYDPIEAAQVKGALASKYYTKRTNESSPYLKLAGGRVVNNRNELLAAVEELESVVNKSTSLPSYVTEYGVMYLRQCQLILENGEVSENSYAYLFPNSKTDDEVAVFFLYFHGAIASYFGTGVLTEDGIVKLNQEEV